MPTSALAPDRAAATAARGEGGLPRGGAVVGRVDRVLDRVVDRLPVDEGRRRTVVTMARSMCVSVGTTLLSTVVLVVLALGAGVAAGPANVVGTLCGIGPSYVYNRRWAWRRDGRGSVWREALPFWVLSLTGLVVSTMAVSRTAALLSSWPAPVRAVALPLANLTVFAGLWTVQFVLLDRVLFRGDHGGPGSAGEPAAGPGGQAAAPPATSSADGTLRTVRRGTRNRASNARTPAAAKAAR